MCHMYMYTYMYVCSVNGHFTMVLIQDQYTFKEMCIYMHIMITYTWCRIDMEVWHILIMCYMYMCTCTCAQGAQSYLTGCWKSVATSDDVLSKKTLR